MDITTHGDKEGKESYDKGLERKNTYEKKSGNEANEQRNSATYSLVVNSDEGALREG